MENIVLNPGLFICICFDIFWLLAFTIFAVSYIADALIKLSSKLFTTLRHKIHNEKK